VFEGSQLEESAAAKTSFGQSTARVIWRYSFYTLVITVLMFALAPIAEQGGVQAFKEAGAIEWGQLSMLLIMGLLFLRESFATQQMRELFLIFACLLIFVSIRELDFVLDEIPGVTWKYAYVLVLYAIYVGVKHSTAFKDQVAQLTHSRSLPLLWAGFIIAIPFAQLVGNGDFLRALVEDYSRDYKRVIEEVGELTGYLLMLLGSIEIVLETRAGSATSSSGSSRC